MVGSRTLTAVSVLAATLALSAIAWHVFGFPFFFVAVPFVPFLFRGREERPAVRECPACGFRTRDPAFDYCPRDGTELESRKG